METQTSSGEARLPPQTVRGCGLPRGCQVGPYHIERILGQGGMGVVYRAWDSELERAVALKALPSELAAIPERAELLTVEARVLAALNHPHIETIHGLIQGEDGTRYLVLEHLEGELLSARLAREPLPLASALEIGRAVAAALEAAHGSGIIHRDLKPSNVMLTRTGPKVLDFGLARRFRKTPRDDASGVATWTAAMAGAGTPGYSSPEQSLGEPQDRSTDLFSLGCLLYECLSGRRAFRGPTAGEARRAVLTATPEWEGLPRETPVAVRSLLERCLAKSPEQRLADAAEARRVLEAELAQHTGARPARAPAGSGFASIPLPLTSFIGRSKEIQEGEALLEKSRLLTLTGPGGCGKTRLSIALAGRVGAALRDGVCFVDLSPLSDPGRVPQAILAAAGVRENPGSPCAEVLAHAWVEGELLLVLDNCEHVIAAVAEAAATLLVRVPGLRILATSREPLQIQGEQVYLVPSLGSDAARLFADRAAAVRPSFALTAENRAAVEDICAALDGMPLALELAAARAHVLSLAQIRSSLRDRFRFLTGGTRAGGRHRTLRSAVDWSFDLLESEERRFFAALSVFAGGFTLEAAEAVYVAESGAPTALDRVGRLVDKSLVSPPAPDDGPAPGPAGGPRFRLLETLRSYAAERLVESGEEEAVRDRHLGHYLSVAERGSADLTGPAQAACLERLEADHENFLTALSWCERRKEAGGCGLRLAASLWRFWLARGHFSLGRTVLRMALSRGAAGDSSARAEVLMGVGALAFHQNDWDVATASYEEARGMMERLGIEAGVGQALVGLGNVAMGRGAYPKADESYRHALVRFDRAGNERGKALVASNRGRVAELQGDLARARTLHEEGIVRFERIGDAASLAVRLSSLAELCLKLGDADACRNRLSACLELVLSLDERRAGCYALERTALLAEASGDPAAALRWCGASNALRLRIASPLTPAEERGVAVIIERARHSLGSTADRVWAEGRALSFEEAATGAIRWLEVPCPPFGPAVPATRAAAGAANPSIETARAR